MQFIGEYSLDAIRKSLQPSQRQVAVELHSASSRSALDIAVRFDCPNPCWRLTAAVRLMDTASAPIERHIRAVGPVDRLIWKWEDSIWQIGDCLGSPQLDQGEAQSLLNVLWRRHRSKGSPYFEDPPAVVIDSDSRVAGLASYQHHRITLQPRESRKPFLIHEAAHLLTPNSGHGGEWCALMLTLWELELGVPKGVAMQAAHELTMQRSVPARGVCAP